MSTFTATPFFGSLGLAAVVSSFSIWRNLREDYDDEEIFKLTFLVLTSSLLFSWFFSLSGAFVGMVLAVIFRISKLKRSFWEVLDAFSLPMIYFFLIGGFGWFLTTGNLLDLLYPSFGGAGGFLFFSLMKKKYRSFPWYKSGKTGFLFWVTSFFLSFFLLGLAFCQKKPLYWEEISWALILVVSLLAIYWRSERRRLDLKWPR